MEDNIKEFIEIFNKVKNLGWIQSINKGKGSVGRTFEQFLGFEENSFEIPDYKGIEVKTKLSNKNKYITLFCCKPESNFYNETARLKDTYGYYDKNIKNCKVLNNSVFVTHKTVIGNKYKFQLEIDYDKKRIYLCIFDMNNIIIERQSYWSFDELNEKLNRKLKFLAYIKANKKMINDKEFFKYYKLNIYELKTFDDFLYLLSKGYIRINFKIGIYKSGKNLGKMYDHGTSIDIIENKIINLYNKIESI